MGEAKELEVDRIFMTKVSKGAALDLIHPWQVKGSRSCRVSNAPPPNLHIPFKVINHRNHYIDPPTLSQQPIMDDDDH